MTFLLIQTGRRSLAPKSPTPRSRVLHDVLGLEPRPMRFVNSLGLGEQPSIEHVRRRLARSLGVRFKLDAEAAWREGTRRGGVLVVKPAPQPPDDRHARAADSGEQCEYLQQADRHTVAVGKSGDARV